MSAGEELDAIQKRMAAAYDAWRDAGYPYDSPEAAEVDNVYADLRAWNERVGGKSS